MRKASSIGSLFLALSVLLGASALLLAGCGKKEEDMSKTPGYYTGDRVNHNKDTKKAGSTGQ